MALVNTNQKSHEIHDYFSRIAIPYDFFNHFFSMGIDLYWRRQLTLAVKRQNPELTLDLATGTGDVALALKKMKLSVIGFDFCQPMLEIAQKKKFTSVSGADAHRLPLANQTVDAVTIAFGYRNFTDKSCVLEELRRVLKPGGKLYILEFSQPSLWIRPFYYFYLDRMMPVITGVFCNEKSAYKHLSSSVMAFPAAQQFKLFLQNHAFKSVSFKSMTFGTVALHVACK